MERLSVNSSLFGPSPRLRHGDCKAQWWTVRSFGNRNGESSRTSAKETKKTEIVYEVNHTEPSSIWPSFIQHNDKWREIRPGKAQCKAKGKKNKRVQEI